MRLPLPAGIRNSAVSIKFGHVRLARCASRHRDQLHLSSSRRCASINFIYPGSFLIPRRTHFSTPRWVVPEQNRDEVGEFQKLQ